MKSTLFYLGAIIAGLLVQWDGASVLVEPAIFLLMVVTFCELPAKITLPTGRFVRTLLIANFLWVPVVVGGLLSLDRLFTGGELLSRSDVRLAVVVVLVSPCIDYVITFTKLSKGAAARLLAMTPVLLAVQFLLLPLWLSLFGIDGAGITLGPLFQAFLIFIVIPYLLAIVVRKLPTDKVMDPLMVIVLFVITSSNGIAISTEIAHVAMIYVMFALIIFFTMRLIAKGSTEEKTALTFSAVTRNALVMYPIIMALPVATELTALVIVTQTVVELIAMIIMTTWFSNRLQAAKNAL